MSVREWLEKRKTIILKEPLVKKIGSSPGQALSTKAEECPLNVQTAYRTLYRNITELESLHHKLPNDSETPQGKIVVQMEDVDNLAKWMLERTTCIQKEIALQMKGCNLFYLVDNPHIMEEIDLLQKDMAILKSAYTKWKKLS